MINARARVSFRLRVMFTVNARAMITVMVRTGAKTRACVSVRVMVIFRVRAGAESRASVSVRLWLGQG